ncbi:NAD(P)H-binding protein [Myxococcus sp. 1LA]
MRSAARPCSGVISNEPLGAPRRASGAGDPQMKIAIFGATGGIGRFVVKHALNRGHEVRAYVRNPIQASSLNWTNGRFVTPTNAPGMGKCKVGRAVSGRTRERHPFCVINSLAVSTKSRSAPERCARLG